MTKSDTIPKTKKEGKTMPETLQIKTKIGNIRIVAQEGNIIEVSFLPEDTILSKTETQNPVLQEAKKQLIEYIEGKRQEFDLPLHPVGTAFRQKVTKNSVWRSAYLPANSNSHRKSKSLQSSRNGKPL